jgi:hypothetical protein
MAPSERSRIGCRPFRICCQEPLTWDSQRFDPQIPDELQISRAFRVLTARKGYGVSECTDDGVPVEL